MEAPKCGHPDCNEPASEIKLAGRVVGYKARCWRHLHGTDDTPEKKEALKRSNDDAWEKFIGK